MTETDTETSVPSGAETDATAAVADKTGGDDTSRLEADDSRSSSESTS